MKKMQSFYPYSISDPKGHWYIWDLTIWLQTFPVLGEGRYEWEHLNCDLILLWWPIMPPCRVQTPAHCKARQSPRYTPANVMCDIFKFNMINTITHSTPPHPHRQNKELRGGEGLSPSLWALIAIKNSPWHFELKLWPSSRTRNIICMKY